jgi:hypothetical protein
MRALVLTLTILLAAAAAEATVFLPADLGDLSRDAYAIARGRILASEARWTTGERRAIETVVTMETGAWLKRNLGQTIQFRVPGGRLGRYRNIVIGAPEFAPGQHVIVFLGASPPSLPFVLGLSQGVFRLAGSAGAWVVTPPAVLPTAGPPIKIVRGDPARRPMPLADFEQRVRTLAGGAQ